MLYKPLSVREMLVEDGMIREFDCILILDDLPVMLYVILITQLHWKSQKHEHETYVGKCII